jgi:hypothetical protein
MKKLFERIIAWGANKGIHDIEFNPLQQTGFLLKELTEVNDEFIAGNIDNAVGEICDLIIYCVNALKLLNPELTKDVFNYDVVPKPFELEDNSHVITGLLGTVFHISTQSQRFRNSRALPNYYFQLIERCCTFIESLGYSPAIALEETVKKIESRQGAWNQETGKWEKTETLYTPNYAKASLSRNESVDLAKKYRPVRGDK